MTSVDLAQTDHSMPPISASNAGPASYFESGEKLRRNFVEGSPLNGEQLSSSSTVPNTECLWVAEGLITRSLAPHAPYTVCDENLQKIARLSEQLDLPVHMHLHETRNEVIDSQLCR
jgi:cytosine/adenosine deaminase-related metal-dependent hydrolase